MKRDIYKSLLEWKQDARKRPLLMRGARQVGKSYLIDLFGKNEFEELVTINFEQNPEFKKCFDSFYPSQILEKLSVLTGKDISPGKSLLFLDEIQECPQAIVALRYFYEQLPALHVIGAGSLLEFTMRTADFRMPVGRVQYLYLRPLSFMEFLSALDEEKLRLYLEGFPCESRVSEEIHRHALDWLKKYMLLGGMPAVVEEYRLSGNMQRCFDIQRIIIQTYHDDFGKYARQAEQKYLQKFLYAGPKLIGQKFHYARIDAEVQSRELKKALELLEMAGVFKKIKKTSGEGLPLEALADEKFFKLMVLDIGLMQNICGLDRETVLATDLLQVNAGALAEQFVAQELVAAANPGSDTGLFYWAREAKSSNAEVDYLLAFHGRVLPLEVKSGSTGRLRSLQLFIETYHTSLGIKTSQQNFDATLPVVSIPLYAVGLIDRWLRKMESAG